MQGIGRILAGAALLAGAYAAPSKWNRAWADTAQAPADETALAVPRILPPLGGNVPLATPLAPSEAAEVRRIYALQQSGEYDQADHETALLGDNLLLGHLRADRLLRQGRKSSAADLSAWLAAYGDHPEAPAIQALLLRVAPKAKIAAGLPPFATLAPETAATVEPEDIDQLEARISRNPALDATVLSFTRAGKLDKAEALLRRTRGLSTDYAAVLHGDMARVLFTQNQDAAAFQIAARAWNEDRRFGEPAYVAGLAAWRMGNIPAASGWFQAAATAPCTTPSLRSGAAFWAARAAQKNRDQTNAQMWLTRAARERHSFYGLLANRLLGHQVGFDRDRPLLAEADVQAIASTPQGLRAFALLQVGQNAQAEAEFRALWPHLQNWPEMQRALLRVADQAQMTGLAAQLAVLVQCASGTANDLARFPTPTLKPARGFTVDQPLVYALARIESNFQSSAISSAGARGLMQLTPTTASFITGGKIDYERLLHNPATNLDLGQRYLIYLAGIDSVNADLVRLLASYNAGPGAVSRWNIADHGDPLMYIESIPLDETRAFVPRALTYSWIYAARFKQPSESLEALAAGSWPQFTARTLH